MGDRDGWLDGLCISSGMDLLELAALSSSGWPGNVPSLSRLSSMGSRIVGTLMSSDGDTPCQKAKGQKKNNVHSKKIQRGAILQNWDSRSEICLRLRMSRDKVFILKFASFMLVFNRGAYRLCYLINIKWSSRCPDWVCWFCNVPIVNSCRTVQGVKLSITSSHVSANISWLLSLQVIIEASGTEREPTLQWRPGYHAQQLRMDGTRWHDGTLMSGSWDLVDSCDTDLAAKTTCKKIKACATYDEYLL